MTVTTPAGATSLTDLFAQRLEAVMGSCEIGQSHSDVVRRVITRLQQWQAEIEDADARPAVLSWAEDHLPIPNLHHHLDEAKFVRIVPNDLHTPDQRSRAANVRLGITGVDAAFASTGSVVLVSGPGKSRTASLLPEYHLMLVPRSLIFANFEAWLAHARDSDTLLRRLREAGQIAFVTGPSKSGDIELNLTLGVHGPRAVHAIVVDDGRDR